jgi:integrase
VPAGTIYFEHAKGAVCRESRHRSCAGTWRGEVQIMRDGKRQRRRVNGASRSEVQDRLDDILDELRAGVVAPADYTVEQTVQDWIESLGKLAPKTIKTKRELLAPLLEEIGATVLRDLTTDDVLRALRASAAKRSNRTMSDSRAALVSAITYAQARGKVGRNVAALVKAPPGKSPGRPSRALTQEQAEAALRAARKDRLFAYLVVSLVTGIRTEEARALCWDHVDLNGDAQTGTPTHIDVFRSVRAHGGVKTRTSRRTLALPELAQAALEEHRDKQKTDGMFQADGLVFSTRNGTVLDAGNVRRSFKRICEAAGIGRKWTPRELRHSFVSLMSDRGVPLERIADMVGHAGGSSVTGRIYRQQLQPVITVGAEVMDDIFGRRTPQPRLAARVRRPKPPLLRPKCLTVLYVCHCPYETPRDTECLSLGTAQPPTGPWRGQLGRRRTPRAQFPQTADCAAGGPGEVTA